MDTTASRPIPSYTAPHKNDLIWNVLTFTVLLSTICLVGIFSLVYLFPNSPYNPFSSVAAPVLATSAPTDKPAEMEPTRIFEPSLPPTINPPTIEPPLVSTQVPTETSLPIVEVTAIPFIPSDTPDLDIGIYPFDLRNDPAYVPSTIMHPDEGCSWMGVGGQVFDRQGAPLLGVSVLISGKLNGKTISLLSLTGTARQYGEAGYEFYLGDQPLDTKASLWIQLLDQAQINISPKVPVTTFSDCQKNLLLINFRQVR